MKRLWSSFQFRLLLGSLLWTAGLLYIVHVVSLVLIIGHRAFEGRFGISHVGGVVSIVLMVTGLLVVRTILHSFNDLRRRLGDVHEGRERRVTGTHLGEVQPLVDDLNTLLEHHDRRVRDALAKAGDLAHGLKTPLAVLAHDADRLAAAGHEDQAATLRHQIERMRRHIEYHLAHARAAASGATPGARCGVAESAQAIARTLQRLHAQRGLTIRVDTPDRHAVRGQREDLDEILGNLIDNACKWARREVVVASTNGDGRIIITIDDDGPGIPAAMREAVLQRGVRADEAAPGSGFGLAIVRDLVDVYGGSIALSESTLGGLRARVELPPA